MSSIPPPKHTYIGDPENPAETARLMHQSVLVTLGMGGVLPEVTVPLFDNSRILDVCCGPGEWCLQVGFEHQDAEVIGIDISQTMVEYAAAQARVQHLDNVSFRVMNVLEPLDFADHSFDIVNARFMIGVLKRDTWPAVLAEYYRVCRPGGIIRLTECDNGGTSTSPAYDRLQSLFSIVLNQAGYGFAASEVAYKGYGITPMLGKFLADAGCCAIRHSPYALDFSAGTPLHSPQYQNCLVAFQLAKPVILEKSELAEKEFDDIYQRMLAELNENDFRAIWYLLTVSGTKPPERRS